jgi:hypothetical protein
VTSTVSEVSLELSGFVDFVESFRHKSSRGPIRREFKKVLRLEVPLVGTCEAAPQMKLSRTLIFFLGLRMLTEVNLNFGVKTFSLAFPPFGSSHATGSAKPPSVLK